jgi:hypothetical protein
MQNLPSETVYANNVDYGADANSYGGMDNKSPYGPGGGPPYATPGGSSHAELYSPGTYTPGTYTPGPGPQKAGYSSLVPSGVELPQSPPAYYGDSATPSSHPMATEQYPAGTAEMYGGNMRHELNE